MGRRQGGICFLGECPLYAHSDVLIDAGSTCVRLGANAFAVEGFKKLVVGEDV